MPSVSLLDLMKLRNGSDGLLHLVEAIGAAAPEVLALPSDTIKGTSYDTTIVTALPTTGFRKINQGVAASSARFETRKAECHILDTRIEVDKAAAASHDKGPDHLMAMFSRLSGKSAILTVGKQTIYGTANDATGFYGLQEMADSTMVVDAGGTTDDTASSVYMLFAGEFGVQYVYGMDSTFDLQPFVEGEGTDADGNKFPAWVSYLNARVGLANSSPYSVGRIKKLTADSGKVLTDALLSQLLEKFPTDSFPTHILMNRRSRGQLQRARTVVLQGSGSKGSVGSQGGLIAPLPTEFEGIPIICTDSIVNTEKLAS
jgi:hypothetical protein